MPPSPAVLPDWLKRSLPPPLAAAVTAVTVAGLLLAARGLGTLEGLELAAYDVAVSLRADALAREERVTLLVVSEADIQRLGNWPLTDAQLASTLALVLRHEPRGVAVDIYRDIHVPPGRAALADLLAAHANVVLPTRFGDALGGGVAPPPELAGGEQVGFNNYPLDSDGAVRRGLLFADVDGESLVSLSLRMALLYLAGEDIAPEADAEHPEWMRLGRSSFRPLEENDGPYAGVDASGYQFLLDWRPGARPFVSFTLDDLEAGRIPPAALKDRLVLLGVAAESVKDTFHTPYTRVLDVDEQIFGVAVHAFAAAQIVRAALEGDAGVRSWSEPVETTWLVLWTAAGALLGLWARSAVRLGLAVPGGLVALAAAAYAAYAGGRWIPVIPPALGWGASAALVVAYTSRYEREQRTALMQIFHRQVSREVADDIWAHRDEFMRGGRPRPQQLIATVLFSDIRGFTTVSEKLGPVGLMEWLNEYMGAMAEQVLAHNGVIDKFIGDAVMAVFGVPVPRTSESDRDEDARLAVRCALAMGERLVELNAEWKKRGIPEIGIRIGIFTGELLAGSLGSADRLEYTVIGDTVNTASRLESFRGGTAQPEIDEMPCRILIGDPTLARVDGRFETRKVGDVTLKGKTVPVGLHLVLGEVDGRPPPAGR